MAKIIKEGPGWRLGVDDQAIAFPALVGAEDWAVELTALEFADFCRLSQELAATVRAIAPELMAEERICCELASELIWLEVEGYSHSYQLRFILQQGRRAEGQWSAPAVPALLGALAQNGQVKGKRV